MNNITKDLSYQSDSFIALTGHRKHLESNNNISYIRIIYLLLVQEKV